MNEIKTYYENLETEKLVLPKYSSQRQFRIDCGTFWKPIRDRVDSPEKLKKVLIKYAPLSVYATIGLWLNPTTLSKIKKIRQIKPFNL